MKKELFILIDHADLKSAEFSAVEKCDRLAMTPGAMLAFEKADLSYMTFEDFYGHDKFAVDNEALISAAENFLRVLDEKYEPLINYPRAFTSNIYFFMVFFDSIYYISKASEAISCKYDKVCIGGSSACRSPFKIDMDFSSSGLTFSTFGFGLNNIVNMLGICLTPKCRFVWQFVEGRKDAGAGISRHKLAHSMRLLPKKILAKLHGILSGLGIGRKKVIFVIQGGFEVDLLKRYMPECVFMNPVDRLFGMIANGKGGTSDIPPLFDRDLENFTSDYFPKFKAHLSELFSMFHDKVICSIGRFKKGMEEIFSEYNPAALFYSSGAIRVHEDLAAYIANRKKIPVFYFQHGGTNMLWSHPYHKYTERNANIKKINLLSSRLERESLVKTISPESRAFGSIKFYRHFRGFEKSDPGRFKRKALYCVGSFNFFALKDLVFNPPDKVLHEISKDIIEAADKHGQEMDVKIGPGDESHHYLYFKSLLGYYRNKGTKLLKTGFPVEMIIKDYGLLILDRNGTSLLLVALTLNIPTILYLKDIRSVNKDSLSDINKKFYLARNRSELDMYMSLYKDGKLEPKIALDVLDKYHFPIDAGDPGVNISNYIREKISITS